MILVRAVRRFGETRPVDAIPAAELRAWLLELRATLAPESIAGYVRGLKAFGNWCAAEELAAAAGFRGLRRPKVPHRLIAPFSDPELRSLLALADERERALALVLLDTGLRLSELASLRVGDVRPDGTLHVMGKGAKERIVPIGASARRVIAARERAATERAERVRRALARLPELEAAKRRAGKPADEARASTTDHEARVMKMADGGYRPAYNVQFAADTTSQVIVGLDVIATGNDQGQLSPMVRQLEGRYGRAPDALLADAGFLKTADIDELACGTTLYVPVRTPEAATRDPYQPLPDDSPAVAAWRIRMGTAEAKERYKDRAATAECVNAIARNRGLQRFGVRGREKARAIGVWFALAHNLMRTVALREAAAAT